MKPSSMAANMGCPGAAQCCSASQRQVWKRHFSQWILPEGLSATHGFRIRPMNGFVTCIEKCKKIKCIAQYIAKRMS